MSVFLPSCSVDGVYLLQDAHDVVWRGSTAGMSQLGEEADDAALLLALPLMLSRGKVVVQALGSQHTLESRVEKAGVPHIN